MDFLYLMFNNNPEISGLFRCFSSQEAFESAIVPYEVPQVRECGGFLKFGCKSYVVYCPLDGHLYNACLRYRKEDLYPIVSQKLREHVETVKLLIALVLKALEMQENPDDTLKRLHCMWRNTYGLAVNMLYKWLTTVDENEVRKTFNSLLRKLSMFGDRLPTLLRHIREETLPLDQQQLAAAGEVSASNVSRGDVSKKKETRRTGPYDRK